MPEAGFLLLRVQHAVFQKRNCVNVLVCICGSWFFFFELAMHMVIVVRAGLSTKIAKT